jgi:predicted ATPase/DNA-binding SARP family transcriptional activator
MDFAVLGPLRVTDGTVQLDVGGARQRRLLAQLVMRVNEVVSLDRLIASVWDEGTVPEKADRVIRSYVSRLRRSLQPSASADELRAMIPARPPGYVLEVDPDRVDAARVERLAAEGRTRLDLDEPDAALELLDRALELFRGRPYDEFADLGWAVAEAQRLDELRAQIHEHQIDCRLHLALHQDLIPELEALVERYPLREGLWGQLMLALYRCGRQADALRAYGSLRETLAEELGIDPSPSIQELETRILRQDVDLAVRPNGRPARVASSRLPAPLTSLIGRDGDVAAVIEAARSTRLVTVIGVGGVGKTRIALEATRWASTDFDGGAWWAELAPVGERADLLSVIASALDLTPNPGADVLESIVGGIGDEHLLLAIDNCEHVIDYVCELVEEILARCPRTVILSTSREPLGVAGEFVIPLGPLAVAGTGGDTSGAAVVLFMDRARASGATVAEVDGVVADICRRLDGLPLAIELAAGLTRTLDTVEIRDGLKQRFELLVGARRTSDRHRTLRNTLTWSYDLLHDEERDLLHWLAVFAGQFSLDDLQRVSGQGQGYLVTTLRDLVDKSLLVATPEGGRTRYRLLETVREFAAEHLEAAELAAPRRTAHARAFGQLALELGELSRGPEEAEAVQRAVDSIDNLREAYRWAEITGDADTALTIVTELFDVGKWTGRYEILDWAESVLAMPGARATSRGATAVAISGECALMRGEFAEAERLALEAISMDPPAHRPSLAHYVHSGVAWFTGDRGQTVERARIMRESAERSGSHLDALLARSQEIRVRWNEPEARDAMEQLIAQARELGNGIALSQIHMYRGGLRHSLGDPECHLDMRESARIAGRCGYGLMQARASRQAAVQEGMTVEDPRRQLVEVIDVTTRFRGPEMALDRMQALALVQLLLGRLERWDDLAVLAGFKTPTRPPIHANTGEEVDRIEERARLVLGADRYDALVARGSEMGLAEVLEVARPDPS